MLFFLGLLSVFLQTVRFAPQAYRLIRRHDYAGVSVSTWQMGFVNGVLWVDLSLIHHYSALLVANAASGMTSLVILVLIYRARNHSRVFSELLAGALLVAAVSLTGFYAPSVISFASVVITYLMYLPQAITTWKSGPSPVYPRLRGLWSASRPSPGASTPCPPTPCPP